MSNSKFCRCESPLFLSFPYRYNFVFDWNEIFRDYMLFRSCFVSQNHYWPLNLNFGEIIKTLQELRMLSSVTINCQVTKIVMNSGSQLSELYSVSQMSQVSRIALRRCSQNVFVFVFVIVFVNFFGSCHVSSSLWTNLSKVSSL